VAGRDRRRRTVRPGWDGTGRGMRSDLTRRSTATSAPTGWVPAHTAASGNFGSRTTAYRRRQDARPSRRRLAPTGGGRWRQMARWAVAMVSVFVFTVTGYGWSQYHDLLTGVGRSDAIRADAPKSAGGDTNILIMGLDSRLDENGNPLPADVYQALHAGDQQVGGYNANVLMLVHLPGDGSKATAISIPRDDYVSLPGSPDGVAKGKIKQAYGLAFDQEHRRLVAAGITDPTSLEQRSRDAGRAEEVDTVAQFLGGVPIDHFVEVTLMGFYQLAQVVAPITVCLNEDTRDSFSGADFHRGYQQINAAQAVAFVRQRRDYVHPQLNFTDLDRERRQQAFIASLVYQLKQAGTFLNPARLRALINVAKQNIAADTGLELLSFAERASTLAGGNITFTTLPIVRFGTDPAGEDVNIVNVPEIQALVHNIIGGPTPTPVAESPSPALPRRSDTIDVVNATNRNGLAAGLEHAMANTGFTPGVASTATRHRKTTMIYYPDPGSTGMANTLSAMLGGVPTVRDSTVPAGHLRIILGTDFTMPEDLPTDGVPEAGDSSPSSGIPSALGAAPHSGAGPTEPDSITGGGVPCVK
jgi:LCP family protein required for cell wall assembly